MNMHSKRIPGGLAIGLASEYDDSTASFVTNFCHILVTEDENVIIRQKYRI
jgi:hypothetical protein